jgi:hypothetical protein
MSNSNSSSSSTDVFAVNIRRGIQSIDRLREAMLGDEEDHRHMLAVLTTREQTITDTVRLCETMLSTYQQNDKHLANILGHCLTLQRSLNYNSLPELSSIAKLSLPPETLASCEPPSRSHHP